MRAFECFVRTVFVREVLLECVYLAMCVKACLSECVG